jgi:hypothetical protein
MQRIFFFLLGFGMTIIGFFYIIAYLNLLTLGYTISEYLLFIIKRLECWNAIIGIIMVILTIFIGG